MTAIDSASPAHSSSDPFDDLGAAYSRRRLLMLLGSGAALAAGSVAAGRWSSVGASSVPTIDACSVIPEETAGPYPGDGSNGPNVLSLDGVIRQDIRPNIGEIVSVVDGVPMALELVLVDSSDGCTPLAEAAVYAWHCDATGRYSMYSSGAENDTFLRGVQVADANGVLRFDSIFPGCYPGRWPHIHFEVFPSADDALAGTNRLATSQVALPEAISTEIYADARYGSSAGNLSRLSLTTDNVFADDGGVAQLATIMGAIGDDDLRARLVVGV